MYVCICRQVTDNQIRDLCRSGSSKLADIRTKLGIATECGKCSKQARHILSEFATKTPFTDAAR